MRREKKYMFGFGNKNKSKTAPRSDERLKNHASVELPFVQGQLTLTLVGSYSTRVLSEVLSHALSKQMLQIQMGLDLASMTLSKNQTATVLESSDFDFGYGDDSFRLTITLTTSSTINPQLAGQLLFGIVGAEIIDTITMLKIHELEEVTGQRIFPHPEEMIMGLMESLFGGPLPDDLAAAGIPTFVIRRHP